jgi:hypothetical protein
MRIALALALFGSCSLAAAGEPRFVHVGEAFTSPTEEIGVRGGWRMTTVPFLEDYCPSLPKPAKLVVTRPINLTRQVWFPYSSLVVLALDESGRLIPDVPISMDVEEKQPPLLALRADLLGEDRVLPIAAGNFRFRFRTICGDRAVSVIATATVRPE